MRIAAIVKRIFLQIIRDKRTLALLFIAPLLVLSLMKFVFDGDEVTPHIGVHGGAAPLIEQLQQMNLDVTTFDEVENDQQLLIDHNLDGLLNMADGEISLTLTNEEPNLAKSIEMKVTQVIQLQVKPKNINPSSNAFTVHYVYGDSDTKFFDTLSPMLIGFFVFLFVFLISGIGLLNERTSGTLERLLATPIKRVEIILGYLIGYGILACIQTIIVALFAIEILDMVMVGSIWDVLLLNILTAFVALSLGILLSTFASSEFQMIQFIPLVIVPQIFFSGIFPMDGMADWLKNLSYLMPLYYAADALKGIMYMGQSLGYYTKHIVILIGFIVAFIVLNLLALKKYRKL